MYAAVVYATRRVWSPSSVARSRNVLMPDQMAAASTGTSSRPMAMASWRWSESDQNDRIFPKPYRLSMGSATPACANPAARSVQLSQRPHGRPCGSGS